MHSPFISSFFPFPAGHPVPEGTLHPDALLPAAGSDAVSTAPAALLPALPVTGAGTCGYMILSIMPPAGWRSAPVALYWHA